MHKQPTQIETFWSHDSEDLDIQVNHFIKKEKVDVIDIKLCVTDIEQGNDMAFCAMVIYKPRDE